ncbi:MULTISPECIES: hypothetical protein [unclassified Blastococcus]
MSDPHGRPAWGPPPAWSPQSPPQAPPPRAWSPEPPAWSAQPPTGSPQPAAWSPRQPAWTPQQPPAGPAPAGGGGGRQARTRLWWALGAALLAVVVAAAVTVFLLTRQVDAPTAVQAAVADDAVAVTWRPADGATEYEVRRGDEILGTTAETTYLDTDAPGGTEQRYAVTALDDDGDRSESVETGPVVTPLDPLTDFGATSDGTDVVLDWTPVAGADRYEITRDGTLLDDALLESPYVDRDVPLGDHAYGLTAVDEDGAGSRTSIDLTFFARGPWQEAYEIGEAFPDLVGTRPGSVAWQDASCDRDTPDGELAVVSCAYPNGIRLRVLQYADAAARDAEVDGARGLGGPQTTWSYGDGPAEGDLVLSPPGPATWRYVTFYDGDLELFVLRVDWDGHSHEELDAAWFADAPF